MGFGVIMYGLARGRFPFKNEHDIKNMGIKIPTVHPVCEELIKKMLDKNETTRFSANQVMAHVWITSNGNPSGEVLAGAPGTKTTKSIDNVDELGDLCGRIRRLSPASNPMLLGAATIPDSKCSDIFKL